MAPDARSQPGVCPDGLAQHSFLCLLSLSGDPLELRPYTSGHSLPPVVEKRVQALIQAFFKESWAMGLAALGCWGQSRGLQFRPQGWGGGENCSG